MNQSLSCTLFLVTSRVFPADDDDDRSTASGSRRLDNSIHIVWETVSNAATECSEQRQSKNRIEQ